MTENDECWWVRVQGREYGPVARATLLEWRGEGRLLPANEVRHADEGNWITAAEVPGLFEPPPLPEKTFALSARAQPGLGQIIAESLRIYRRAFFAFLGSTLLVSMPMLVLNLTSNTYGIFRQSESSGLSAANVTALLAFTWLAVAWPIYLASIQLAAVDARAGRKVPLFALWRRAVNFFPRMAVLSVIVYGSYFFWSALPLIAMATLVGGGPTLPGIFLALLLLAVQIVMVARLFVNFMFWQQAAVISGHDGAAAIRESKLLARSKRAPARPLWRGIILASLWFVAVLTISTLSELPWALPHFRELAAPEQVFAFLQKVNSGPHQLEPLLIGGAIFASLMHSLIRPIVGIAFVLLYFDARSDFTHEELEPAVPSNTR